MVVKCGGGREVSLEVSRRATSLGARNGVCVCVCGGGGGGGVRVIRRLKYYDIVVQCTHIL